MQTGTEDVTKRTDGTTASANDDMSKSDYSSVGRSSMLITALVIISRLTGFVRTWAMGFAFGVSSISASYNIANNLPNMLYELVVGGMLVTAFLPVYMDVRKNRGEKASSEYVGNLLGVLLVVLGVISVAATVFAPGVIWTQTFMSGGGDVADLSTWFFRFFAVQILLYGLGSVFSGVLNAHRDYFWSNFAPVLNNVVTIASFLSFVPLSAISEQLALTVIAVGTTLGVAVQMACQIPAMMRLGIRPRVHLDLRDQALRKTLSIGVPTLVATACTFVTSSVQNAAAMNAQPDAGASVIAYARLWYTLPYALIAVSLTTALYTELSRDATSGNYDSVREGLSSGIGKLMFWLVPFAMYLIVFAQPLNMIYCAGEFDMDGVNLVSEYLMYLAPALPLYGVCMLMQKACSSLMDMKPYMVSMLCGSAAQIAVCMVGGVQLGFGMPAIALSTAAFYAVSNVISVAWARRRLGGLHMRSVLSGTLRGAALGAIGSIVGIFVMNALETFIAPLTSASADGTLVMTSSLLTFAYVAVAGVCALVATFGTAAWLEMDEVDVISGVVAKLRRK